jgi:hypothetical protein
MDHRDEGAQLYEEVRRLRSKALRIVGETVVALRESRQLLAQREALRAWTSEILGRWPRPKNGQPTA